MERDDIRFKFDSNSIPNSIPPRLGIALASLFGWVYFTAWTFSFYPQLWTNFRLRSTDGMSYDFAVFNLLGFLTYLVFDVIRFIVQQKFHLANAVEIQDLTFVLHATLVCTLLFAQIFLYDNNRQPKRFSITCQVFALITVIGLVIHGCSVWLGFLTLTEVPTASSIPSFIPYSFTDFAGSVKVVVTLVKYWPQILLNYHRKCTYGMAVWGFNLDFAGGIFSIGQNLMDWYNHNDINYLTGNLPKLSIGLIALSYDITLFVQHYVLYRRNNKEIAKRLSSPSLTTGRRLGVETISLSKRQPISIISTSDD